MLRELIFGSHRFDAIVDATARRETSCPPPARAGAAGLMDRRRYQDRPPRSSTT